jgi:plasmid stabilization system protein ParE
MAEIHAYVRRHDPAAADRLALAIYAHLDRIAATGHSGVPRNNVRRGLRLAVHGRYNIYVRVTASETIIVRVVHSARDATRLQFDDNGVP